MIQESHEDRSHSLRAPTSSFDLASLSLARPASFHSRKIHQRINMLNISKRIPLHVLPKQASCGTTSLFRYNGNKFQRCTTEVFDRVTTDSDEKKDEEEKGGRGCERERLPRRRQGESRLPVQSRTVSKLLSKW